MIAEFKTKEKGFETRLVINELSLNNSLQIIGEEPLKGCTYSFIIDEDDLELMVIVLNKRLDQIRRFK